MSMTIEYIVKGALGVGLREVVYRVHADGEPSRSEVLRDGEVSSRGRVPPDSMARLESELGRLNGVPLLIEGRACVCRDASQIRHKLVVENGGASFCFFWRDDPPEQWLPLPEVARIVVDISGGPVV